MFIKMAIATRDMNIFRFIQGCFPGEYRFSRIDQPGDIDRALSNCEFNGLLLDAQLTQDEESTFACLQSRRVPLVVLRALREPDFSARSLEAAADEIVLLPLDANEVYLRTRHALRRFRGESSGQPHDEVAFANYRLERRGEKVTLSGASADLADTAVRLTSREFAILWALSVAPGHYLSRQQIASAIWASNEDIVGRSLEQHIYTIRKKMKMRSESGARIRTIYSRGYQLASN